MFKRGLAVTRCKIHFGRRIKTYIKTNEFSETKTFPGFSVLICYNILATSNPFHSTNDTNISYDISYFYERVTT